MAAIDQALNDEGLQPFQRPLHVGLKFWDAFGWEGLAFPPKELADQSGFNGDVLMAKAYRWYEETYGDKLKGDFAYGFAPTRLGNALWRVRFGVIYGTVRLFVDRNLKNQGIQLGSQGAGASFNVLCAIEGLPQGLVDRLPDKALREYFDFHCLMHANLQWRESLPPTDLLLMAQADYDESTASVLGGRFGQARWAAQQAVEKTLKGLLTIAGTPYPTGGVNGHNLRFIGSLLETRLAITVNPAILDLAVCSAKVRYAEEPSSEDQALAANHAALWVLDQLRVSPKISELLKLATVGA